MLSRALQYIAARIVRGIIPPIIRELLEIVFAPGPVPRGIEEIYDLAKARLLRHVLPGPVWQDLIRVLQGELDIPEILTFKKTIRYSLKIPTDIAFLVHPLPNARITWRAVIFDAEARTYYRVSGSGPLGRALKREDWLNWVIRALKARYPHVSSGLIRYLITSGFFFTQFYVSFSIRVPGE